MNDLLNGFISICVIVTLSLLMFILIMLVLNLLGFRK